MTDLSVAAIALIAASALFIGFSKAGLGGAVGPMPTMLMLFALPAHVAIGVQLPILIVGDVIAVALLWRKWDYRHVWAVVPGAIVGIIAGTYLIAATPADPLRRVLGVFALLFACYSLLEHRFRPQRAAKDAAWQGPVTGTAVGVTSAIAHVGGPPLTAYLLSKRLDPVTFVATAAITFTIVNLLKVPPYLMAGLFDWELQLQLWWVLILVPVGAVAGRLLLTRISATLFKRVVIVFLFATGIILITT